MMAALKLSPAEILKVAPLQGDVYSIVQHAKRGQRLRKDEALRCGRDMHPLYTTALSQAFEKTDVQHGSIISSSFM